MKRFPIVLAVILLFTQNVAGKGFKDYSSAQLYQLLCAVNGEWKKKPELAEQVYSPFDDFAEENLLRTHLMLVEQFLRANPPADLNSTQMDRRMHHLGVLNAYWKAGKFPNNPSFPERTPFFIGENGNFCAVGYLMWQDGQEEIVKLIEREINTAYVRDIPYSALSEWAFDNGFEVSEIAWIQPTYASYGEWVEGVFYEHLGGKTYRIWLHNASPCGNANNSQVYDTTGFSFTPYGCPSVQPVPVSQWAEIPLGYVFNGCNPLVPCANGASGLVEIQRKYFFRDYDFTNTGCPIWKITKLAGPRFFGIMPGTMSPGNDIWLPASTIDLNNPNSAPKINGVPMPTVAVGTAAPASLSLGVIDPDGDSLVFALDTPRVSATSYFYYTPYPGDTTGSYGNPLGNAYDLTVHPRTGDIEIAYKSGGGGYNRAINLMFRVDEYRNGIKINSTYQELRLDVYFSADNTPILNDPIVQAGGTWNSTDRFVEMCVSDSLVMDVSLSANGASGNLVLLRQPMHTGFKFYDAATGNQTSVISGATPTARITYKATQPGWYMVPLYGQNDRCPMIGNIQRMIPVWVKPSQTVAIQEDSIGCAAVSLTFPSVPGYNSWSWTGDFIQPVNDSMITVNYPQPGTYNFQVFATSPAGCPISTQGQVVIPNTGQPDYSVQIAQFACESASFEVVPNSGTQPWTYSWTGTGGLATNPNVTDSMLSQTFPSTGIYDWTVVVTDGSGCAVEQSGSVNLVDNAPGFISGHSINGCIPTIDFGVFPDSGVGSYTTLWSGDGGINGNPDRFLDNFQHVFPGPGTYNVSVTLTSSTGCDSTKSMQVTIPGINPAIFSSNDTLFTNYAISYQWYRDSILIPGANNRYFTGGIPGNYAVYVTTVNGCAGLSPYLFFDFITGLTESKYGIKIFPNPSNSVFNIELSKEISGDWSVELVDMNGRKLIRKDKLQGRFGQIDVADFPAGFYFLKLAHDKGAMVRKIQISR